jgi:hypothetical protein
MKRNHFVKSILTGVLSMNSLPEFKKYTAGLDRTGAADAGSVRWPRITDERNRG